MIAETAIAGGANGVTILSGALIADRNGQSHAGPIALVASGGTSSGGALRSFDLTTPSSPTALGSTQLTNAAGQTPPAGVSSFVGTPHAIAAGSDGLAFVAIEGVGASSVQIGQAIPVDATVPARGAGARYPSPGAESASDVARLGERLLVAGVAGLTVLDAATMQRVGGVSTTGNAQGVAALPAFRMDVNGDGAIAPATEVFDLAVVANGIDGTLQFYRVPAIGDPVLLSAVRFSGAETTDVQVDATERLAYVALGSRGLAIVDLDGPASVQPIDGDRNGVGRSVAGTCQRTCVSPRPSPSPRTGISDGTSIQLCGSSAHTPRTTILSLVRNPVRVITGDEQSIAGDSRAFLTDDEIRVAVDVQSPSGDSLTLSVDEAVTSGDIAVLQFEGGSTLRPLTDGLNEVRLSSPTTRRPRRAAPGSRFLPLAARVVRRVRFDSRHPTMCKAISRPCASVRIPQSSAIATRPSKSASRDSSRTAVPST